MRCVKLFSFFFFNPLTPMVAPEHQNFKLNFLKVDQTFGHSVCCMMFCRMFTNICTSFIKFS